MNTDDVKKCPKCQTSVPPEAPEGLCPKCLLAGAMMATEVGQPVEPIQLPSIEQVAAVFPHLEILELIGRGGMGVVFKARQPKLDRFVALKLLPERPGMDPAFGERFHREARVLARLSHPNIVMVHDFGKAGTFYYLLMEFVDGVNLRQAMRAGRFTSAQALTLVPKICDALQYAHEEGVLHRDIKPENLLLDTRGRVKIADFGIAKLVGDSKDITLTARGAAVGTPHYMAPEQLEHPHDVDHRADVYSLGVVFYEMLTGELPLGRFDPPSQKAPMDPRVDQVVLRTLEKERERRFQSAGDVRTQVEKISATPAPEPNPASVTKPLEAPPVLPTSSTNAAAPSLNPFRWSIRAIVAAGLVAMSLLTFGVASLRGRHIGPDGTFFVGLLATVGTALGAFTLRDFRSVQQQRRGGRLALLSTVAWPLAIFTVFLVTFATFLVGNFQWHVFGDQNGPIATLAGVMASFAVLTIDVLAVKHCLKRWRNNRELPHADLIGFLRRFPARGLWFAGAGLAVLWLILFADHKHINEMAETRNQAPPVAEPNAPSGYEVASGAIPQENREYRSPVTIPAGYALTLSPVLCSNQVVVKRYAQHASATFVATQGHPVDGQVTWNLLGNSTFDDGAPMRVTFSAAGEEKAAQTIHIVPPETVTVDWVGEPSRIWPPQNGHTKFLLLKGSTANPSPDAPQTEWAVGIEAHLAPISGNPTGDETPAVSTNQPEATETSVETPQN